MQSIFILTRFMLAFIKHRLIARTLQVPGNFSRTMNRGISFVAQKNIVFLSSEDQHKKDVGGRSILARTETVDKYTQRKDATVCLDVTANQPVSHVAFLFSARGICGPAHLVSSTVQIPKESHNLSPPHDFPTLLASK